MFTVAELRRATSDFRQDLLLGKGGFGEVYKGWVDENMLSPSEPGSGIAIAVKWFDQGSSQGHAEWQTFFPRIVFSMADLQDFNAKLDFGLAKPHVSTRVVGTYGYAAPEYLMTGHLKVKNDIYGFGVVLLETLTGLRVLDRNRPYGQQNLVELASPFLASRKKLNKILDPRMEQNYPIEAAEKCAELILRCLAINPKDRPSSEELLKSLEQIYAIKK